MSVSLGKMFNVGCGDNSCTWGNKGGMATNGGCRCPELDGRSLRGKNPEEQRKRLDTRSGILLLRQLAALPEVELALKALIAEVKK